MIGRVIRRVFFSLGLVLVAALIAAGVYATAWVKAIGEGQLRAAGFAQGRIARASIDLSGVRFDEIRADPTGSIRADSVLIPWSRAMLRGQINEATIVGARIAIAPGQAGAAPVEWGPPPALVLNFRDAELSIATDMGAMVVALNASGLPSPDGRELRLTGEGRVRQIATPPFLPELGAVIEASVTAEGIVLNVRLSGANGVTATLTGQVRPAAGDGELRFVSGPIRLSAQAPIAAASPAAGAMLDSILRQPVGIVTVDGRLGWNRTGLNSAGRIRIDDLAFVSDAGPVRGVSGMLAFASLDPPRLDGPQTFRVRRVDASLPVTDAEIDLRQNAAGDFSIGRARASALGGRIEAGPIAISDARQQVAVRLTTIGLNDVLTLGAPEGLRGTGRLSGQIQLQVSAEGATIQRGELAATAPGTLVYAPRERPQLGDQAAVLLDVLSDFHYDQLTVTFVRERNQTAARLHIEGRNPSFQDGHRVNLNVNLSGALEQALQSALGVFRVPAELLRGIETLERARR